MTECYMATAATENGQADVDLEQEIQAKMRKYEMIKGVYEELEILEYRNTKIGIKDCDMLGNIIQRGSYDLLREIKLLEQKQSVKNIGEVYRKIKENLVELERNIQNKKEEYKRNKVKTQMYEEIRTIKEEYIKMERRNENYRRNIYIRNNGFGRRSNYVLRCYRCQKDGHIALNCNIVLDRSVKTDGCCYGFDKYKRRRKEQAIYSKDEILKKYEEVFDVLDKPIKYCKLEKCKYETEEGKKVVKKGVQCPQALEGRAKEYLANLIGGLGSQPPSGDSWATLD
ncbi:hypothetical protein BDAP_000689 [Binucleata daphniae]